MTLFSEKYIHSFLGDFFPWASYVAHAHFWKWKLKEFAVAAGNYQSYGGFLNGIFVLNDDQVEEDSQLNRIGAVTHSNLSQDSKSFSCLTSKGGENAVPEFQSLPRGHAVYWNSQMLQVPDAMKYRESEAHTREDNVYE